MKEFICIVCPRGCHLKVDEDNEYEVIGYHCLRGKEYGQNEACRPVRTLTSTIKVKNASQDRVSVKTTIPKEKINEVMEYLKTLEVSPPLCIGDVVAHDICGTDSDLMITKQLLE